VRGAKAVAEDEDVRMIEHNVDFAEALAFRMISIDHGVQMDRGVNVQVCQG
jgi:hypothetical protein